MDYKKAGRAIKEKRVIKGLDNEAALNQLLELAGRLDITVRQEKGDFKGGSCRLDKDRLLFLRKTDPDAVKIETLINELAPLSSDHIKLDPALRQYLNMSGE